MKRLRVFAVVTVVCLLASSVYSQEEAGEAYEWEKDDLEVTLYGAAGIPASGITDFGPDLNAQTGWSLGMDIGYFATYSLNVGLSLQYVQFGVDSDFDGKLTQHHNLYSPALYAKYSFLGESSFEPYLTARMGLDFAKFSTKTDDRWRELSYDPSFSLGASAGVFYFTSDASGLFLEVGYHHGFTDGALGEHLDVDYTFGQNINMVDVRLGVRLLIGPGN